MAESPASQSFKPKQPQKRSTEIKSPRPKRTIKAAALFAVGFGVLALAAVASGETVRAGNLILELEGSVSPKALSKTKFEPISLNVEGGIATADGSQPPATKEIIVDTDKNGMVNPTGLPACSIAKIEATNTESAEKACPKAIVGKGVTDVRVLFPESTPFTAEGPLVLFNGGSKGGKALLLIHAYVNVPTPTAIVTTITISKEHDGVYGTHSVALVPTIAGGAGSVTKFRLTIHRLFTYKGRKESYLVARCFTGHFYAHVTAKFVNGTEISGSVVKACQKKG